MLQEKPSALKKEHSALQNKKFLRFFSIYVGHFCPPGSGSSRQKSTRIHADLDLQHWLLQTLSMRVYTTVYRESSETRNLFFKKQYKVVRGCTCTFLFCTVTVKGTV